MGKYIPVLMIGLFVLVSVLTVVISLKAQSNARKRLREMAARMGLKYYEGSDLASMPEVPGQARNLMQSMGGAGSVFMKLMNVWRIEGPYNGVSMVIYPEVRGSGKSSTTYTIFKAFFKAPLNLGLVIAKEGIFQKLGKAVLHSQDIQVGNPELDKMVIIKGQDENRVKSLLMSPVVQKNVMDLFRNYPGTHIDDTCITYEHLGATSREDLFRAVLNTLSASAVNFRAS